MSNYTFDIYEGKKVFSEKKLRSARPMTRIIKQPTTIADITIVIPVFEREEALTCIHYIIDSLRASKSTANLAVIDQSLTSSIKESILSGLHASSQTPELSSILYHHDITLTISTAKNKGVELLRRHLGGWRKLSATLIFIDSDVYVPRSMFSELFKNTRGRPDVGAFGFPSTWLQDEKDLRYLADSNYPLTSQPHKPEGLIMEQGFPLDTPALLQVPAIHGCLFAIRTALFKKHGGFHPFFAMHGEHVELSARLNDNQHKLAYIMQLPILHDDRSTLRYSVMRNMPSRERFVLATLAAMMARNNIYQEHQTSHAFMKMVRHMWLKNVGITGEHTEPVVHALLKLSKLLRHYESKKVQQFYDQAYSLLTTSELDEHTKKLLLEAAAYLRDNFTLLRTVLAAPAAAHTPLYDIKRQVK